MGRLKRLVAINVHNELTTKPQNHFFNCKHMDSLDRTGGCTEYSALGLALFVIPITQPITI